MSKKAY